MLKTYNAKDKNCEKKANKNLCHFFFLNLW